MDLQGLVVRGHQLRRHGVQRHALGGPGAVAADGGAGERRRTEASSEQRGRGGEPLEEGFEAELEGRQRRRGTI